MVETERSAGVVPQASLLSLTTASVAPTPDPKDAVRLRSEPPPRLPKEAH